MSKITFLDFSVPVIFMLLTAACSSSTPLQIEQSLYDAPSVKQVKESVVDYISQTVRWGGVIVATENKVEASWLTIVAFPLDDDGRPTITDQSSGRFIAIVTDFLEPVVYSKGRQITVKGVLIRAESQMVGDFSYQYPVIEVDNHHLWPKIEKPVAMDYPPYWYYDPWFRSDFYPRHYYPYRLIPKHP